MRGERGKVKPAEEEKRKKTIKKSVEKKFVPQASHTCFSFLSKNIVSETEVARVQHLFPP